MKWKLPFKYAKSYTTKKPFKYIKLIAYGRKITNGHHWDMEAWRRWYRWVLENKL